VVHINKLFLNGQLFNYRLRNYLLSVKV